MCQIIVVVILATRLGEQGNDTAAFSEKIDEVIPNLPHKRFAEWSLEEWKTFASLLESVKDGLLRRDAAHTNTEEEDDLIDASKARSLDYKNILRYIQTSIQTSPIRAAVEDLIVAGEQTEDDPPALEEVLQEDLVEKWW
jgi:hypothetical protein